MLELAWVGVASRGVTALAYVRSCQKFSLCPAEPMPARSRTDPPLVKPQPIKNGFSGFSNPMELPYGNASVIADL